jgi:hypothetical protein
VLSGDSEIGRREIDEIVKLTSQFEFRLGQPLPVLEPFEFVSLEDSVSKISKHLGLDGYRCMVEVKDVFDSPKTSGTYSFSGLDPNVFKVGVRSGFNKYGQLEILCHELTHHYMHVHGVREKFVGVSDEIATDYMMIYLGLGKIALNGVKECKSDHNPYHWLGYVDFTRLTIMYRLVCKLGGVDDSESYTHLRSHCQEQLAYVELQCSNMLTVEYYGSCKIKNVGFFDSVIGDIKSFFGL